MISFLTCQFEYTEPSPNVFNYSGGDTILAIAENHGKRVRCHNLIWVSQLPDWVVNGSWTAASLTAVMKTHITNLITHWGGRCYSWDVVNEALAANGSWASSIWYDTIGPEYFFLAYRFAQEAVEKTGQDIKLYYNDYGIEAPGPKTTAAYNLVKELQARGIRIDGVGLESHFEVGATPSKDAQVEAKQGFLDLGVDVVVTELDVRFPEGPFYTAAGEKQQAQDYYDTVASCVEVGPRCVGITVWDFDDAYSWVPSSFPGQGAADLYNGTLQRKPAYYAVAEALQGVSCSVC
ncbi:Endo-1,4-beta-xylanase [Rasamsonia emersonii CBS 393.64]|uniref:Beta-xylanase n=1 Tax=Rasamsonia emersonii (strain ATCC 16479 / CBS 393.64 / IMI 116815) TaxID=1408163 RepID=A0A0F4YIA9_RASE3|nr:Endo-1,4-beta-xylanase [Rasamsonia emersonii CBS 393.64]KKA17323.1 Endo-1,4-beta-xylanase [Rasamsonia emersonii CBS 393.64]